MRRHSDRWQRRIAIAANLLALAVLVFFILKAEAADYVLVEFVRVSEADWECQDAEGKTISRHNRFDKAESSCAVLKFENPENDYYIQGGKYEARIQ